MQTPGQPTHAQALADALAHPASIQICGYDERMGMVVPLYVMPWPAGLVAPADGQLSLACIGQIDQLKTPMPPGGDTPQEDRPVQPPNCGTAGNPARLTTKATVNVTVFFATGQSKVVAD